MFKLAVRKDSKTLYFNGTYLGFRCREYTGLKDNRESRRLMNLKLKAINEAIQRGVFRYSQFFPDSKNATDISFTEKQVARVPVNNKLQYLPQGLRQITPTLHDFADLWMDENKISWRKSHRASIEGILAKHVMPVFGAMPLETIKREHILQFRTQLSELKGKNGIGLLSNSRINKVMSTLRQVLNEAALRYDFATPYQNIKQLKSKPKDIHPFSLSEVSKILDNVRADYKNYYTVRFFTGMRTGEIDGLKWRYVDFERRLILVRETIVNGIQEDETKTLSSQREIEMSDVVFNALKSQFLATNDVSDYVFCTTTGSPLAHNNVTKRVWKPYKARVTGSSPVASTTSFVSPYFFQFYS